MTEPSTPATAPADARTVDGGRGVNWWTDAWALFMRHALMWFALGLILILVFALVSLVPLLGAFATALLLPVFVGSWMLAARKVEGGGALEVADLFTCFQGDKIAPLLLLGALLLAAMVVVGLVGGVLGAGAVFAGAMGGARHSMGAAMAAAGMGLFALLVMFAFGVIAAMAFWFAPALVVFRNTPPVDAVRLSIGAVLKNVVPFLVFGLIHIVLMIVASIPFGLGWFVLAPVSLLAVYGSYKDVFGSWISTDRDPQTN